MTPPPSPEHDSSPAGEGGRPDDLSASESQAVELAELADLAEQAERGARHLTGRGGIAVTIVAVSWSLFQLALPAVVTLSSDYVRVIHLCFALAMVYLCFPAVRKRRTRGVWGFLSARRRLPVIDVTLALLAVAAAAYYALDYTGIAARQGKPLGRDLVVGIVLIVLVLEAARRALGMALTVVASAFILYALFGSYMPDLLAFRGASVRRLVGQLTLSTEGLYGVPLRVAAETVFLFVLLGAMLEKTGGGHYFVQLAFSLLGRYRGGPAKAAVLSSGLTGMVSGSSIANVVTTGTFTIPLMTKSGYPPEHAAAIEVAASTNGQLMPPIMGAAAFIIAEYCGLSYLEVVRAAFVPAVVSYLALIYITHLEAGKLGLKGIPREELPRFLPVLISGVHFLIPLAALVTMLVRGYSAGMAAFYAIIALAVLVMVRGPLVATRSGHSRRAGLIEAARLLGRSLVAGAKGMMGVGVACAAAGIIVGIVGMGPGQRITEVVDVLSAGNIFLILLLTAGASLVLGMGLPTTATYIVMASLTAEVIVNLAGAAGVEVPRVAAHLFCFYFGILADDTPPVGLAAYAAAAIAKSNPITTGLRGFFYDLRTAILPFAFVFNTDLLLWNVHGWGRIILIFASATLAMFAFAGLTQHFLRTRNRVYESVMLAFSAVLLLHPRWPTELLAGPTVGRWLTAWPAWAAGAVEAVAAAGVWPGTLTGAVLFAGVYLLQRRRARRPADIGGVSD